MEYNARSSRLSALEPAHVRATDPERSIASQDGWRPHPHKEGLGIELRDGGSPLALALPDRPSTKPWHANNSEAHAIIASTFEPAVGYPSFAEIIERLDALTA